MANKNWSGGRLKEIKEQISREFEGLPVVDAENDIRLIINSEDIEKSKNNQKDFEHCVFAESCRRLYDSKKVLFMRKVAYMEMPNEDGEHRVERFMISDKAQKVIADFDKGNSPEPGTAFVFKAPSEVETLEYNRKRQKEFWQRRKQEKKEAKMNGTISEKSETDSKNSVNGGRGLNKTISDPSKDTVDVRSGRGLIQMKRAANE